MNIPTINNSKFSRSLLIALLIFLFSALVLSGCGSAAAKTKKKKVAKAEDEADVAEVAKEESNSHADESVKPSEANKAEEKTAGEETKDNDNKSTEKKTVDKKDADKKDESKHSNDKAANSKAESKSDKKHSEEKGEKAPSGDEIWAGLMKGNKLFMRGKYSIGNILGERGGLAKAQHPQVIVLGCADSRVPPELVFGKNTGDLFVVRDAGNIVDEVSLGSIEYAVEHLHAKVIVILGHESCGAVAATVSGEKMPSPNLQAIVNTISPAFEGSDKCEIGGKMNTSCVELNVNQTAKNILSKSPILKKATGEGLVIIKAIYRLESGEVVRLP